MDKRTSASILERVKAAKEKQANELGNALTDVAAGGIAGGLNGIMPGALMGVGYGHAKGREGAGAVRGATRGAMTLGGVGAGATAGYHAAQHAGVTPTQAAIASLIGGAGGGLLGWKGTDAMIGDKMEEKKGFDPSTNAFSDALQGMAAGQLKSDALKDVANVGMTSLGVGAAGRGIIGLIQMMKANKPKKTRSGPAYLPLPYPAEAKQANFLEGDVASSKSGIPWYGPAMMLGGLGGLGLGWKGMDKVLNARREREQQNDLESARQQFHDALLSQYDEPIKVHPDVLKKKAADSTMEKVGKALDALFDKFQAAMETETIEKQAFDMSNLAGQAAGGYGMYAGLSGLLTGALVYDKANKRSRRSVLDAALKQRQRRKFMQQPTEIMAVPEPMESAATGG